MKRIVQVLTSALLLTASAAPARSFNITASLATTLREAIAASRAHPNRTAALRGAELAISTFDKQIVDAFNQAWKRSGNGLSSLEGVVLILRMADGSYSGRDMGSTNEDRQFTFLWHPATIAIVHTHPNRSSPEPQDEDIAVANKYHVPVFTITIRGMYVYDPDTRKISKVMSELDWLDSSKFSKASLTRQ